MTQPFRLAQRRRASTAAATLGFQLRRPHLCRASRRHARLRAARQRRSARRAQLQISPAARHLHGRSRGAQRARRAAPRRAPRAQLARHHRSSCSTGLVADSQNRWPSLALRPARDQRTALALPAGRLLLQDLHVAALVLGEGLRAADPPHAQVSADAARRAPTPTPTSTRTRTATCWSSARAPRGSPRHAPPAQAARACMLVEQDFELGGGAAARSAGHDGWRNEMLARAGGNARSARAAAHDRVRLLRPQRARRGRARVGSSARAATRTRVRQRFWVIRARQVVLATGAIERLIAFPDNDRPGVMLASRGRRLRAPLRRRAGPPRRAVHQQRRGLRQRAFALRDAGVGSCRPSSTPRATRRQPMRRAARGFTVWTGAEVIGVAGSQGVRGVHVRWRDGRPDRRQSRADLLCVSGGLNPSRQSREHDPARR